MPSPRARAGVVEWRVLRGGFRALPAVVLFAVAALGGDAVPLQCLPRVLRYTIACVMVSQERNPLDAFRKYYRRGSANGSENFSDVTNSWSVSDSRNAMSSSSSAAEIENPATKGLRSGLAPCPECAAMPPLA